MKGKRHAKGKRCERKVRSKEGNVGKIQRKLKTGRRERGGYYQGGTAGLSGKDATIPKRHAVGG